MTKDNGVVVIPEHSSFLAPLVVTIVGPACRGKSLAAHKISRNLFWKGEDVKGERHLNFLFPCFTSRCSSQTWHWLILEFHLNANYYKILNLRMSSDDLLNLSFQ